MKIGKFAEIHEVTLDTIRFYIEKGLLVPSKKNSQYNFSEIDSNNLERIKELKELGFSLSEIQKIFSFQRIGGVSTELSRRLFLDLLEEKKRYISKQICKYNRFYYALGDKIDKIKFTEGNHEERLGFPISSLDMLLCPYCHEPLSFSQGVIENNMVITSDIFCTCGYEAKISDGIFIDSSAVRVKLLNGKVMPSKEEYLERASLSNINYLHKGMAKLIEYIISYQGEAGYIMEMSNCVGFFLLQYISFLPKNAVYILVDYDLERIKQMKRNLERYYSHKRFIFLCCNINTLPLKKASIDIIVDYFMSKHYQKEYNRCLIETITPYLRNQGIFGGIYPYNKHQASSSKDKSTKDSNVFRRDEILNNIASHGIEGLNIWDIDREKEGDQYKLIFVGKKKDF